MVLKDYYTTLRVSRHATGADIKKSYRRLAMKYHPDKNHGDALAGEVFSDIAEAYKVLSDSAARLKYDQRYAGFFNNQGDAVKQATAADVVAGIAKLQKTLAPLNTLRLNLDALYFQLTQILSPFNLQLLREIPLEERRVAIRQLLNCCSPLAYGSAKKIAGLLLALAGDDKTAGNDVNLFLKQGLGKSRWEKYKVWGAVTLAIALCLLMFLLNR